VRKQEPSSIHHEFDLVSPPKIQDFPGRRDSEVASGPIFKLGNIGKNWKCLEKELGEEISKGEIAVF